MKKFILGEHTELKAKLINLVQQFPSLWAFAENNSSYGHTNDLEFHVELFNVNSKPFQSKFRVLNEDKSASLRLQAQEWFEHGEITYHDIIPADTWCSAFVPQLKPQGNAQLLDGAQILGCLMPKQSQ